MNTTLILLSAAGVWLLFGRGASSTTIERPVSDDRDTVTDAINTMPTYQTLAGRKSRREQQLADALAAKQNRYVIDLGQRRANRGQR